MGSSTAIWKISLRFFSPPEKPSFTGRFSSDASMSSSLAFSRTKRHELHGVELVEAPVLADGVERGLQEVGVVHAGDLDRILERQEQALAGALLGVHVEQVVALVEHRALGDFVLGACRPGCRPACSCPTRWAP